MTAVRFRQHRTIFRRALRSSPSIDGVSTPANEAFPVQKSLVPVKPHSKERI